MPQKNDILEMNTLFATEFKNIFILYKMDFGTAGTIMVTNLGELIGVIGDDGVPLKPLQVIWVEIDNSGLTSLIWK